MPISACFLYYQSFVVRQGDWFVCWCAPCSIPLLNEREVSCLVNCFLCFTNTVIIRSPISFGSTFSKLYCPPFFVLLRGDKFPDVLLWANKSLHVLLRVNKSLYLLLRVNKSLLVLLRVNKSLYLLLRANESSPMMMVIKCYPYIGWQG